MTNRHRVAVALLSLGALVGSVGPVAADSDGDVRDETDVVASEYAAVYSVSPDEARRQLSLQVEIGRLEEALVETDSDTFAGLMIVHAPEYEVIIFETERAD